ncbi:CKLF-like MARVEL transmembrane domain-containing protein 4 [Acanthaster planci]|uniref:CKLF-like MARVEL transmembrane domain-containing protein 4 n=1 Tax=Acanthaster planci TaxID=133434 RepID=A0A8B7XV34_ACAPL|nr:CKLF-like MARVEL transmembrane domain-containing protein 4 [Acanthaster planci]
MADKTVEVSTVSQHTVVTASTTTTANLQGNSAAGAKCTCDMSFLRSLQGITKMAEIVLSLVAFIVMLSSRSDLRNAGLNFFLFVAIAAVLVSSLCLALLSTRLHLKVPLPWNLVFAGLYAIMFLVYFIAFILAAVNAIDAKHGSAVTLGFFACVAYFGSLFFAVQDWRLNRQMTQESQGATGTYTEQHDTPPAYEASY